MTDSKTRVTVVNQGPDKLKLSLPTKLPLRTTLGRLGPRLKAVRWGGRGGRFVLLALVLIALCAGGVLWSVNSSHDQKAEAGQDALAFAQKAVPKLLSYDATTVNSLPSRNASLMTTKFGDDFADLVKTKLAPGVHKRALTNQTDVVTAAVISAGESRTTLLLFLNQTSSAKGMSAPATTGSRVTVTVVKDDGKWKIDELEPV